MASRNKRRSSGDSFTADYLSWDDKRLDGNRRQLDQALGSLRTGSSEELAASRETFVARASNPNNNPATRTGAERDIARVDRVASTPGVEAKRTQISDISGRYGAALDRAVDYAIDTDQPIPGTAWYFEHNRSAQAELPSDHGLSTRQITAMGGKLSSGKTPEDERTSLGGITSLLGAHKDATVEGTRVGDMTSEEIGSAASRAAAHSAYRDAPTGKNVRKPSHEDPVASTPETYDALRRAGRAHSDNVISATKIARGEMAPQEAFNPATTPKTAAYAEMQAQSQPGTLVETDYRNISAHYRDVKAERQDRNQGMFMFSQDAPGERAHALAPDSPTAIDTWMIAAGSGQPLAAREAHPETGKPHGRTYSPAKRMADKDMPHDPTRLTKKEIGVGIGDASMTTEAMVSAQHNEAIRRVSENIGAVSHDQFGQDVKIPASLIQESVWTQVRREADKDPAFNAMRRSEMADAAAVAKADKQRQLNTSRNQMRLF